MNESLIMCPSLKSHGCLKCKGMAWHGNFESVYNLDCFYQIADFAFQSFVWSTCLWTVYPFKSLAVLQHMVIPCTSVIIFNCKKWQLLVVALPMQPGEHLVGIM